jgi:hypothetical protein
MMPMKHLFLSSVTLLCSLLSSCSTPEMDAIAGRVQKTRMNNALYAKKARIRVWKDTSTYDKHGWHLHSEQESKFTLPDNEFRTARYLIITHGYTSWNEQDRQPATLTSPSPTHIVDLEWIDKDGRISGSINVPAICRESQLGEITTGDFPFILPDDAYGQFFALPSIGKALDMLKE